MLLSSVLLKEAIGEENSELCAIVQKSLPTSSGGGLAGGDMRNRTLRHL